MSYSYGVQTENGGIYFVQKKRIITIGDSYGRGWSPDVSISDMKGWQYWAQTDLASDNIDIYNCFAQQEGISGFASSLPFLTMLQDEEDNIPVHETITDIVILGGTNDINISVSNIVLAISNFMSYVKTNYPNAKVHIGLIGVNINALYEKVRPAYMQCTLYGAEYIKSSLGLYCLTSQISSDGLHLTQSGYQYYKQWTDEIVLHGKTSYLFRVANQITGTTTTHFGNPCVVSEMTENGCTLYGNGADIDTLGISTFTFDSIGFNKSYQMQLGTISMQMKLPLYYTMFGNDLLFESDVVTGNSSNNVVGFCNYYITDTNLFYGYVNSFASNSINNTSVRVTKSSSITIWL